LFYSFSSQVVRLQSFRAGSSGDSMSYQLTRLKYWNLSFGR